MSARCAMVYEYETEHIDDAGTRWRGPSFWCADDMEAHRMAATYAPLRLSVVGAVTGRRLTHDGQIGYLCRLASLAGGNTAH
jgi:hypothetical protein